MHAQTAKHRIDREIPHPATCCIAASYTKDEWLDLSLETLKM